MQQKPDQARKTLVQFNGDLKQVAEAIQVCEDGRSLKLVKGPKRDRQRALFSQDASMAHTMNKTTPTHMGAFLDSPQRNSVPFSSGNMVGTANSQAV